MVERPILYQPPMVRANLAGKKRQTRRIAKRVSPTWRHVGESNGRFQFFDDIADAHFVRCPYGVVGDQLWMRETYAFDVSLNELRPSDVDPTAGVEYLADGQRRNARASFERGKTRVSIHMPRWASRAALDVKGVRIERLQDISEEDARAEGLKALTKDGGRTIKYGIPDRDGWPGADDDGWPWSEWDVSARKAFATLWSEINGLDSWAANPWLWVLGFRGLP